MISFWRLQVVVVVTFILFLGLSTLVNSYRQELTLYDTYDDTGNSFSYTSHVPDSTFLGSSIKRYCLHGIWILYRDTNFVTRGDHWYSYDGSVICLNNTFPMQSFRFGGSSETAQSAVTLYPRPGFEGPAIEVGDGEWLGNLTAQSFVITGTTAWTFYEGDNFTGRRECRTPLIELMITFRTSLPSPWTNIGSVAPGCNHYD